MFVNYIISKWDGLHFPGTEYFFPYWGNFICLLFVEYSKSSNSNRALWMLRMFVRVYNMEIQWHKWNLPPHYKPWSRWGIDPRTKGDIRYLHFADRVAGEHGLALRPEESNWGLPCCALAEPWHRGSWGRSKGSGRQETGAERDVPSQVSLAPGVCRLISPVEYGSPPTGWRGQR